ncbi:hypothetical protein R5R35_003995 [Gryllus longicercus]|uniref:DNA-3-methyladenine glycosylase n=1 Tax=Gryllus longicercus TaxID=2509291 RepID=A0AAN9VJ70_9ORTH
MKASRKTKKDTDTQQKEKTEDTGEPTDVKKGRQKRKNTDNNALKKVKVALREGNLSDTKLGEAFYNVPCEDLAKNLLGKVLVRCLPNGQKLKGRIVETECYPGGEDKASMTYNGRVTPKTKALYSKPGSTFVYTTYGMYHCINICSQGEGSAVLLRAADPIEGLEYMNMQRLQKRKSTKFQTFKENDLCNGPSKMCISFSIDKTCTEQDLTSWDGLWIETDEKSEEFNPENIVVSTRIGIESAGREWGLKPWRFYVYDGKSVSKRDVKQEEERAKT